MAINKNHLFEDLEGVKCAIVERGITPERAQFLQELLQHNGYEVVVANDPPPKAKPAPKPKPGEEAPPSAPEEPPPPTTLTVGVTDVTFNAINAIFGRRLKTPQGHIVTQAYWLEKEDIARDEIPYYENPAMLGD